MLKTTEKKKEKKNFGAHMSLSLSGHFWSKFVQINARLIFWHELFLSFFFLLLLLMGFFFVCSSTV